MNEITPRFGLPLDLPRKERDLGVPEFHHALNDQVNDLDTLLDQHAARAPAPALSLAQIRGFGPSDSNLKTLLGEF